MIDDVGEGQQEKEWKKTKKRNGKRHHAFENKGNLKRG